MNYLWTHIEEKAWSAEAKYQAVLLILGTLSAFAGFVLWLIIRNFALSTWDWMLCFIGYPVIFSWFVVLFYSCKHNFQDSKPNHKYLGTKNK